ncbi:serine/threonine-protein phosphatase 6 regulatory ankyrin repeat subunit B-like [Phymastichus coffea]|uniref:serine/threonine-protein phosphatase 6 regulatory ankyrin repeat subunit B-like n=1 Tax=Phymastichus coffea TaxID=108790 RepID=UPI00273C2E6B|nr:serine/threonine-protein phosphatase 6 regulatory ankyrin repeat subunit B-like [Phymastichus coffea]
MHRNELFELNRSIGLFTMDEIAKNFKKNKMWVNSVDERGDTPLHIAAKNNQISLIRSMLPYFAHANIVNNQGDTVLHIFIDSCMKNEMDSVNESTNVIRTFPFKSRFFDTKHRIIRSLLSKGADINLKNKQGVTAAQLAAKYGYIDVLKIFKISKRHLCVRTQDGENLLHLICKNAKSPYKDTPMEIKVMSYLINQNCNVDDVDAEGYSAVHYALQTRQVETVKKLVQFGFKIRQWSKKALSKHLLTAAATCDPSVIRFLIQHGADVNVKDPSGMKPLHLASLRVLHQYDAMEILLKSGAHIYAKDNIGQLPLDYALKCANIEGLKCLMEFGVDVINTDSFQQLSIDQIINRGPLEKFALKHFTKLKAAGFKINKAYEPYLNSNDWKKYKRICLEEVKELKLYTVGDNMSLYDLLHMETKYCNHTHLTKLLRILKSSFPIYYRIIRIKIYEIERKTLIKSAISAWYELTNVNLPYYCVENIISYLNSCCLRMMISSSEDRIVYNSVLIQSEWLEES